MIYIKMLFCFMALSSHLLTQAADMDEIIPNDFDTLFKKNFPMGRTANTDPDANLVVWYATLKPLRGVHIYMLTGPTRYIEHLNRTVPSHKVELDEEQKRPTIKDLLDIMGTDYTKQASTDKDFVRRLGEIEQIKIENGSAEWNDENMEEGLFFSCPEKADIEVKRTIKFSAKANEDKLPIKRFETLLKKQYQGAYVIVQKEESRELLQALEETAKTSKVYTTGWRAAVIPQKSSFERALEFLGD